ncbi:MAG: helix-turn-helix domain-containing protein [Spirochaetia bacterium]|nr:helix-turn-helix domain-containing protein [Spirochaetia bacterium]
MKKKHPLRFQDNLSGPHSASLLDKGSFITREFHTIPEEFIWHYHPEFELVVVLSGTGFSYAGDFVGEIAPGDLYLMGENIPHTWYGGKRKVNATHALMIHFRREIFGNILSKNRELRSIEELLDKAKRGIRIRNKPPSEIRQKIINLHELNPESPMRFALLLSILSDFAGSREHELLAHRVQTDDSEVRVKVRNVLTYINEHLREDISQQALARKLSISPSAFSHWFKKNVGLNFITYVNRLRIYLACLLLIETDKSVTEVALESGFVNLSHFHKQFRELKKTTPAQYQRSIARQKKEASETNPVRP